MTNEFPDKPKQIRPFLPARHLAVLGNVAAYYAYLESATEITIWAFLNLDYHRGTAITAGMGTISRIQLLTILAARELAELPEAHTQFLNTLKLIDAARVKRNDAIHALWKHERDKKAETIYALKRSAKGAVKTTSKGVTISELRDLAIEIHWLTLDLQGFIEVFFPDFDMPWTKTPASPENQRTD